VIRTHLPLRRAISNIRHDLDRIRAKDSFSKHAFQVFSSNALVIVGQLVLSPIIARIYGPEAYGIYGFFLALTMNLASLGDMGYSMAYVLPKEDERFLHLVRLNLALTGGIVLACVVAGHTRDFLFTRFPALAPLGDWFLFLGPAVGFYAIATFATQWLIRVKRFRTSSLTGATTDLSMRSFNLVYGFLSQGAMHGLILGELLVRGLAVPVYAKWLVPHGLGRLLHGWSWKAIRRTAGQYYRYPLLVFPERWISLLGNQLPIFLLAGDLRTLGHYALGATLLLVPLRLLGFTFTSVYLQKASDTIDRDPELLSRITKGLYNRLFWVGIVPFTILVFFADEAFRIVLGEDWRDAGVITAYLGVFFFFRLLTEPMVTLFNVQRREHYMLVFQSVLTMFRLVAMLVTIHWGYDSTTVILSFAMVSMAGYLFLSVALLNAAGLPGTSMALRATIPILAIGSLGALLRMVLLGTWWAFPTP
jgi:O-antigen/teichoic acid export membrane protein